MTRDFKPRELLHDMIRSFGEWVLYTFCGAKGVSYMTDEDWKALEQAKAGETVQLKPFGPPIIIKRCSDETESVA